MNNLKLTQWFDGSKFFPSHVGVYERQYEDSSIGWYCKWDGKNWMKPLFSAEYANKEIELSDFQSLNWRGLAKQPK